VIFTGVEYPVSGRQKKIERTRTCHAMRWPTKASQPNVNQRSNCLVGSPEGRDTVVLETPTRSDSSTAPVAIHLLLLQRSSPARTMTTRHVHVRLVRVGAAIPPGKPQELDYQGHSIAASVVVTGGGDEISYSKAVVEQKEGYQDEIH
jgi:hypothetical protein